MKVLVIGSGGREHALAWKLRQSPLLKQLYIAPGNPGTAACGVNVPINVDDVEGLCTFALQEHIDLTVVGPELPLSLGVVDIFRARGLRVFGPTKAAASLESSKAFAKEVMVSAGVPTASYASFSDFAEARTYLQKTGVPIVLKADGLAAGKGVFVCQTMDEALAGLKEIFGSLANSRVVIEEMLEGKEASFICATNGRDIYPFAAAHDYKRLSDGDKGPNTGGMGSVCPTSHLASGAEHDVIAKVMRPVIEEMSRRGAPFSGFLYAGLMISPEGRFSVLEFNTRMGDPECQAILRRLDSDLLKFLFDISGSLETRPAELQWKKEHAVCLVLAADGYPGEVRKGDVIEGIDFASTIPRAVVFHAGTSVGNDKVLKTAGGRVLSVTTLAPELSVARQYAYRAADMIQFRGRQLRRDIGLA